MRWFHRQKKSDVTQASVSDKAASKIAGWMLTLQNKFAGTMNKGFSRLSTVKRKVSVILFSLVGVGLSIYYICTAFMDARKKDPLEKIGSFPIPKTFNDRETEALSQILIDEETIKKVEAFRKYMDSLKKMNSPDYYTIIEARPGLMDSIKALEEIYYSQK